MAHLHYRYGPSEAESPVRGTDMKAAVAGQAGRLRIAAEPVVAVPAVAVVRIAVAAVLVAARDAVPHCHTALSCRDG